MKLKKLCGIAAIILSLSAFGTFSMPDDADARRIGGGRSIGRTTTVRPSAPAGVTTGQQHFQQQRAVGSTAGAAAVNMRAHWVESCWAPAAADFSTLSLSVFSFILV